MLLYTKVSHEEKVRDPKTGKPRMEPVTDASGRPVPEKDGDGKPILAPDGTPKYKMKEMTQVVTTVYATKATRSEVLYENVDTGLSLYPVAWGNWEKQKNQYHGRALVTGSFPIRFLLTPCSPW